MPLEGVDLGRGKRALVPSGRLHPTYQITLPGDLDEHDLPRLSVDIDLAWLPVHDYAEDAKLIAAALGRLLFNRS